MRKLICDLFAYQAKKKKGKSRKGFHDIVGGESEVIILLNKKGLLDALLRGQFLVEFVKWVFLDRVSTFLKTVKTVAKLQVSEFIFFRLLVEICLHGTRSTPSCLVYRLIPVPVIDTFLKYLPMTTAEQAESLKVTTKEGCISVLRCAMREYCVYMCLFMY